MSVTLHLGDCLEVMAGMEAGSVDAIVTDPPYLLNFMGKEFDSQHRTLAGGGSEGRRAQEWHGRWAAAALRVLKPGGYMLAFGGTRTYHRLACAVEDAGFEIRDSLMWIFFTGFPKSKACLKPAYEPILLCRKPGPKVLPLGIDACRIPGAWEKRDGESGAGFKDGKFCGVNGRGEPTHVEGRFRENTAGRWPANIVFTHHPECEPCGTRRVKGSHDRQPPEPGGEYRENREDWRFAARTTNYTDPDGLETVAAWNCHEACPVRRLDEQAGERKSGTASPNGHRRNGGLSEGVYGDGKGLHAKAGDAGHLYGDTGPASRFFPTFAWEADDFTPYLYCPKASRAERNKGLEGMPERVKLRDDLTDEQRAYVIAELKAAGVSL